jgi:hypothetical protein
VGLSVAASLASVWQDPSRTAADRAAALMDAVEDPSEPDPDAIAAVLDALIDGGEAAAAAGLFGWVIATALERAGDGDAHLSSLTGETVERIAAVADEIGRTDIVNITSALLG